MEIMAKCVGKSPLKNIDCEKVACDQNKTLDNVLKHLILIH